ncbi:hypothetical protein ABY58_10350, partial [Edwardsiella ictaluri]
LPNFWGGEGADGMPRYTMPITKLRREYTIGQIPDGSLADARDEGCWGGRSGCKDFQSCLLMIFRVMPTV